MDSRENIINESFESENTEETPELTEISLSSEDSPIINKFNTWLTPGMDAGIGFATGLGTSLGGLLGVIRCMDLPGGWPVYTTLITSAVGGLVVAPTAFLTYKERKHCQIQDYAKCIMVGGSAFAVGILTMGTTAAIPLAYNITNLGAVVGIATGGGLADIALSTAASLLTGIGLFKARECIRGKEEDHQPQQRLSYT